MKIILCMEEKVEKGQWGRLLWWGGGFIGVFSAINCR
jgi:hypothetical protein